MSKHCGITGNINVYDVLDFFREQYFKLLYDDRSLPEEITCAKNRYDLLVDCIIIYELVTQNKIDKLLKKDEV